jgi:hypothetical protein
MARRRRRKKDHTMWWVGGLVVALALGWFANSYTSNLSGYLPRRQ